MDNKFIKDEETGSFDKLCKEWEKLFDLDKDEEWNLKKKKEEEAEKKYEPTILELCDNYEKKYRGLLHDLIIMRKKEEEIAKRKLKKEN